MRCLGLKSIINFQDFFFTPILLGQSHWKRCFLNKHSSWWRRLQDAMIKTNIFALVIRLQKTSLRGLQEVLIKINTFFKMYSKCLQDVLQKRLQHIFKTSYKDIFKTLSRRLIWLNCLSRSRIWLDTRYGQCRKSASVVKMSQVLVFHFTMSFSSCL